MKDDGIRGILLQRYHERRRENCISITPEELRPSTPRQRVPTIQISNGL